MRALRTTLRGILALQGAAAFLIAAVGVLSVVKTRSRLAESPVALAHARSASEITLAIAAALAVIGVVYATSWWSTRSAAATSTRWPLIAGALNIALGIFAVRLSPIAAASGIRFSPIDGLGLVALGLASFFAFSSRALPLSPPADIADAPEDHVPTSASTRYAVTALAVVAQITALIIWHRWGSTQNLVQIHGLLWIALVLVAAIATTVIHGCGQAIFAWCFQAKLSCLAFGPLRWFQQEGKWICKFDAAGFVTPVSSISEDCVADKTAWESVLMISAGTGANVLVGAAAIWAVLHDDWATYGQTWQLLAFTGSFCLISAVLSMIPFVSEGDVYSDGASIQQIAARNRLARQSRAPAPATVSTVTAAEFIQNPPTIATLPTALSEAPPAVPVPPAPEARPPIDSGALVPIHLAESLRAAVASAKAQQIRVPFAPVDAVIPAAIAESSNSSDPATTRLLGALARPAKPPAATTFDSDPVTRVAAVQMTHAQIEGPLEAASETGHVTKAVEAVGSSAEAIEPSATVAAPPILSETSAMTVSAIPEPVAAMNIDPSDDPAALHPVAAVEGVLPRWLASPLSEAVGTGASLFAGPAQIGATSPIPSASGSAAPDLAATEVPEPSCLALAVAPASDLATSPPTNILLSDRLARITARPGVAQPVLTSASAPPTDTGQPVAGMVASATRIPASVLATTPKPPAARIPGTSDAAEPGFVPAAPAAAKSVAVPSAFARRARPAPLASPAPDLDEILAAAGLPKAEITRIDADEGLSAMAMKDPATTKSVAGETTDGLAATSGTPPTPVEPPTAIQQPSSDFAAASVQSSVSVPSPRFTLMSSAPPAVDPPSPLSEKPRYDPLDFFRAAALESLKSSTP